MDTVLITEQDRSDCHQVLHRFVRHFAEPEPTPLYHYTHGDALTKIIESGELWATQLGCLNDAKEMGHAIEVMKRAIAQRRTGEGNEEVRALLDALDAELEIVNPASSSGFVVCFSEKSDDLSQWRAYGRADNAYMIEFDHLKLRSAGLAQSGWLLKVVYDDTKAEKFADAVLTECQGFFLNRLRSGALPGDLWARQFAKLWTESLSYLTPIFKHQAFQAEQEWRMLYFLRGSDDFMKVRVMQRTTMMSRYLPLELGELDGEMKGRLPITSVMVGPSNHREISHVAVTGWLLRCGYLTVPVSVTQTPYRTT